MNWARGATRIWALIIAVTVTAAIIHIGYEIAVWKRENVFDQFDDNYVSLSERVAAPITLLIAVPPVGILFWFLVRWVANGFASDQPK